MNGPFISLYNNNKIKQRNKGGPLSIKVLDTQLLYWFIDFHCFEFKRRFPSFNFPLVVTS